MIDEGILRIISRDVADDPEYFQMQIHDARKLIGLIKTAEKHRLEDKRPSGGITIFVRGARGGGGPGAGGAGGREREGPRGGRPGAPGRREGGRLRTPMPAPGRGGAP